ncbi:CDP-glucose 4,6-dehydratase [Planctomycetales bacterium]|nr:CDP-glucose 4,6-dehydratase [Planctomycetales bacterium]
MLDFYRDKRVLITGHTGFKGSWLCRILLNAGAKVSGYALEPATRPALFNILRLERSMPSVVADVRDLSRLKQAIGEVKPEIVMHLAAQPLVLESYRDPVGTYATNVMGTVNLLEACRHTDFIRSIVNVTTDKVYENKEWVWGYREDENLCGYDPYSNSKSCSELVTYSYRRAFYADPASPALSTARAGNVIGGGDFADHRIIPDGVRALKKGEAMVIRHPNSIRPYQHILDCLSGYLTLAKMQYENPSLAGNYNFGPSADSCVTTENIVRLLGEQWGDGATYRIQPSGGAHEANCLKLDISKAEAVLGWRPRWNVKTAIEKVVEWEKFCPENGDAVGIIDRQISAYFTA